MVLKYFRTQILLVSVEVPRAILFLCVILQYRNVFICSLHFIVPQLE